MKPPLVEGIDYYMEGGKLVLTEGYHLRRGFCCNSRCRHCPYGNAPNQSSTPEPPMVIQGLPTTFKMPS